MAKSKDNKDKSSKNTFEGKFGEHSSSARPKPVKPQEPSTKSKGKNKN
jgi:hypothetical protein